MNKRLFIALNLPPQAKEQIKSILGKFNGSKNIKWTEPDNLHITLFFLGNISAEMQKKIENILHSFENRFNEIELQYQNVNAFPNLNNPKIIILPCRQTNGAFILKFHELLGSELAKLGLKIEKRPWKPHITLGRIKSDHGVKIEAMPEFQNFKIISYELMESILLPQGPEYKIISSYKLQKSQSL